ncbi:type VI secretion system tube protein TssD [Aquimarina sp. AU58]|uniref:type VI secretion system tube protein TssD n=1 Tax=Aquimarina sp. AU58 TaxID=1874112 RepID=UPI000D6E4FA8|nr:type VI secretion system tube protein TssD [Aquimarina sp. AU58]
MGIIAKLYADGQIYNVLQTEQSIIQRSDETGRPTSRPFHTGLIAVIESTKDTYFFEKAIHPTQQIQEIILEYTNSILGGRTRKIRFIDCHVTFDRTDFKANGRESLTETLIITAAGIEDSHSRGKYTTPWRKTEFLSEQVPVTVREEQEAEILEAYWMDEHMENRIDTTVFTKKATLIVKTANIAPGESVQLKIRRKDNQSLGKKKYIMYQGVVNEEGQAEMEPLELDENWIKTN